MTLQFKGDVVVSHIANRRRHAQAGACPYVARRFQQLPPAESRWPRKASAPKDRNGRQMQAM
jgi:hypothetical protein